MLTHAKSQSGSRRRLRLHIPLSHALTGRSYNSSHGEYASHGSLQPRPLPFKPPAAAIQLSQPPCSICIQGLIHLLNSLFSFRRRLCGRLNSGLGVLSLHHSSSREPACPPAWPPSAAQDSLPGSGYQSASHGSRIALSLQLHSFSKSKACSSTVHPASPGFQAFPHKPLPELHQPRDRRQHGLCSHLTFCYASPADA